MKVSKEFFDKLPTFTQYYTHIQALFSEGKTTGHNQSESMLNYTKLSITRMKRGLKTFVINDELLQVAQSSHRKNWLVISEAWCGDAGNIIPIFQKLAEQVPGINLKIMIRDEYPDIMDNYLTNGGRSIPIFVAFDDSFEDVSHWGPRPKPAQDMVMENKKNPKATYDEFAIILQKWYQKDKTLTLQQELIDYLQ